MFSSTNGVSQGGSLSQALTKITPNKPASPEESFGQQLSAVLAKTLEQMGMDPGKINVTIQESGRQSSDTTAAKRQFLVTFEAPPVAAASSQAPATATAAADVTTPDPVSIFRTAIQEAGLNADGISLNEHTDLVVYPGGSYTNHLITAQLGDGKTESFDVRLLMKNPWLGAMDLKRALGILG